MGDSGAFHLLDERIQHYIWSEQWTELQDAQERAIPIIAEGKSDVIIAAATASGKTEAAFLPALTSYLAQEAQALIVYISPLKALINDQFGRLSRLCESLDIPVWRWHGDISASEKKAFQKKPQGVLLITPESVEAMLCNRGTDIPRVFQPALYIVIDELHSFIGSERGKQLQSLLHRIEKAIGRKVARIGLSATLGDISLAAQFLRPGSIDGEVKIIETKGQGGELQVILKGYEEPLVLKPPSSKPGTLLNQGRQDQAIEESGEGEEGPDAEPVAPSRVAVDLFRVLRGSNNLVFPNSRREVERYTHLLSKMCDTAQLPNEFWPHHGSLSKEIRAETEAALKQRTVPANAICTNTLELGIDIGAIKSVAQIGPPPTVAALRQRLGRSGRRKGEPSILRGYSIENELHAKSDALSRLRIDTVQLAATISLLIEKWFEPPAVKGLHFSTLVQQLLSSIAELGGIKAADAYALLCGRGAPFEGTSSTEFMELLRHLGKLDILVQEFSGLLLHGEVGERIVNHYTFYASFATEEEFRIIANGRTLGSLPVSQTLRVGQHILFAGRTWRVEDVNDAEKAIYVTRTKGGAPPLFQGGAGRVHTKIRERMREMLTGTAPLPYLDATAARFLEQGRRGYAELKLGENFVVNEGTQVLLFTWLGDAANEVISCLLNTRGFRCWLAGPAIEIIPGAQSVDTLLDILEDAAQSELPSVEELLADTSNLDGEKWDWSLPKPLLQRAYASARLNIAEASAWLRSAFPQEPVAQR